MLKSLWKKKKEIKTGDTYLGVSGKDLILNLVDVTIDGS